MSCARACKTCDDVDIELCIIHGILVLQATAGVGGMLKQAMGVGGQPMQPIAVQHAQPSVARGEAPVQSMAVSIQKYAGISPLHYLTYCET